MKLYMIRHGQSEANLKGEFAGWSPVPLTPKGEEDARAAGRLIRHIPFDKVYSSNLLRAIQTQQLALPEAECEQTPLIREYSVGDLAGRKLNELEGADLENRRKLDFAPYGGENSDMVYARVAEFMQMLERSDYENVAAFSHAGVIRIALEYVLGSRPERIIFFAKNGTVNIFEYTNGKWKIDTLNYREKL